jgi:proline iminopeptidase
MKAKIRGTEIYFDVMGMQIAPNKKDLTEKPVLFMIHGGPGGNHLHFKFDSLKLQDYAQLIFIDQRGCGLSKKEKSSSYTLENNIEDIEALRKYLGFKKINVLGVSYGGMVAQGYAIRYSKHIDNLILVATSPSYHFIETAKDHLSRIGTKKQISICEKHLWNGNFKNNREVDRYLKIMEPLYIYNKKKKRKTFSTKNIKSNGKIESVISYDVLNAGFNSFLHKYNFIPHLKKIKCPTLVMVGKHDWICRPQHSKIISDNIPDSILKIFNNCGHSVTTDVNEQYIKLIKKVLGKKKKEK